jgi:hypothetical protein
MSDDSDEPTGTVTMVATLNEPGLDGASGRLIEPLVEPVDVERTG